MNFKKFLNTFGILSLATIGVFAEESTKCNEINSLIEESNVSFYETNCTEGDGKLEISIINYGAVDTDKVTSLLEKIFTYSKITYFKIVGCQLTTIPKGIENLKNIETLSLADNEIKDIPKEIFTLTTLKEINLDDNVIEEIPKEIENLVNLEKLSVFANGLKVIPKEIGKLSNLTYIYIPGSNIAEIPKEIGNLTNLEKFFISGPEITEIPKEIGNLVNLKILSIENGNIKDIPKEMENLINLEYLSLTNDNLNIEIPEFLNNLPNLQRIYLDENENLKGKLLTNENLTECEYDENADLCYEGKKPSCLKSNKFKKCNSEPTSTGKNVVKNMVIVHMVNVAVKMVTVVYQKIIALFPKDAN